MKKVLIQIHNLLKVSKTIIIQLIRIRILKFVQIANYKNDIESIFCEECGKKILE